MRADLVETFDNLGLILRATFPGPNANLVEAFVASMHAFVSIDQEKRQETIKRVFAVACDTFKASLLLSVFGSEFEAEFPKAPDTLDCIRMVVGCKETGLGFAAVWRVQS